MIPFSSIFQDVQDQMLAQGDIPISLFNRTSKISELRFIDWITGNITGNQPPEPYTTQKVKDYAAVFIKKFETHIQGNTIDRPADYYGYENMYTLATYTQPEDCEDDEQTTPTEIVKTPITLLDGGQFTERSRTYIDELKPTFKAPIAKMVGKQIEFLPVDLGSMCLEYYRNPVFAQGVVTLDTTFNQEVVDDNASTPYEWDEKARPILVWFIVDLLSNRNSNRAKKEFNSATGKVPHNQP